MTETLIFTSDATISDTDIDGNICEFDSLALVYNYISKIARLYPFDEISGRISDKILYLVEFSLLDTTYDPKKVLKTYLRGKYAHVSIEVENYELANSDE